MSTTDTSDIEEPGYYVTKTTDDCWYIEWLARDTEGPDRSREDQIKYAHACGYED